MEARRRPPADAALVPARQLRSRARRVWVWEVGLRGWVVLREDAVFFVCKKKYFYVSVVGLGSRVNGKTVYFG